MAGQVEGTWDRRMRDAVAERVLQLETEVTLYGQVPKDGLFDAVQDMLDEHPEVFWLSGKSTMRSEPGRRTLQLEELYPLRSVPRMRDELSACLDAVTGFSSNAADDLGKVELAYEWFCRHLRYVPSRLPFEDQTSYAALCLRQAVCAGFSRGFQLVLNALGVPGGIVVGGSDLRALDRHAWNYVVLDGNLLHVDVTAGVSSFERTGTLSHPLFLMPTGRVRSFRHIRTVLDGPKANGVQAPDLPYLARCRSKKELRALLYRDLPPDGQALTVLADEGVFGSQEQFAAEVKRLLAGSTRGMGFGHYMLHPGLVLELW